MANLEKAFQELADVVEHIVGTHVRWNMDMSKTEAVAKIAAARAHAVAADVVEAADDAVDVVTAIREGNVGVAAESGVQVVQDLSKAVKDAKGQGQ